MFVERPASDRIASSVDDRDGRLRADGGTPTRDEDPDARQRRLQALFVDVTGTETLLEPQEQDEVSRLVDGDATSAAVSEYVAEMTRADGLSETLADPDGAEFD